MNSPIDLARPARLWLGLPLFVALVAILATGCTAVQKAEFRPGSKHVNKHPIRVALVLDKPLCKLEQHRDPEGYVYPLGAYLCPCIRHIAHEAFTGDTEYDSLEAAHRAQDVDAILLPEFVKLEIRARGVAWEKRHALAVMQWTLKDIKSQKTIWLATVEGRAEGRVGSGFTMDKKDRKAFQEALDDLYAKSLDAFNTSEEIKAFADGLRR